jgi:hypothetical protein
MLNIFIALIVISLLSFFVVVVGENYVEKLPKESTFKKWWRSNIVGEEPKGKI